MFRIDRRLVKLTNSRSIRPDGDKVPESDAEEDDLPEEEVSIEDTVEMYLSAAEKDIEERAQIALEEARENGRKEAEKIIDNAQSEAAIIRKMAYEDGYKDGQREFEGRLEEERAKDEAALKALLDEIERERESNRDALEGETVALAVEIVRKIFKPAEEELGNTYISLIKNALRQMSADGKFIIRVSPAEYERYFSSGAGEIELDSGTKITVTALRDVSLEEGDAIIDTDDMTVNAGLETQLKYVQLAFERVNQYEPD